MAASRPPLRIPNAAQEPPAPVRISGLGRLAARLRLEGVRSYVHGGTAEGLKSFSRRIGRDLSGSGALNPEVMPLATAAPYEFRLPADTTAPMLARIAVRPLIRDLPDGVATDVAVLASEVVSDAVGHASTTEWEEIVLRVNRDRRIRVEVIDGGTFDPFAPVRPAPNDRWRLFLVNQLASAWGVDRRGDRTIVWFEVDSETSRRPG